MLCELGTQLRSDQPRKERTRERIEEIDENAPLFHPRWRGQFLVAEQLNLGQVE